LINFIPSAEYFFQMSSKIFLMLLSATLLSACENDITTVNIIGSVQKLPRESALNIETIYSDSAKVKVKLTSPEMNRYVTKSPYMEMPKGVKILFYDDKMNVKTELTANYAIRYENERRMEARNNVIVINERGEKLNTERLIWDEATATIRTEAYVKITTEDEVIFGDGLESNQDFSKYRILKPQGTINIKDEAQPEK